MSVYLMKNPRFMLLIVALIFVSGSVAFVLLPRQEDPRLSPRVGRIITVLPGANPLRVESLVTEKLEDELDEIEEIKEITSVSSTNLSLTVIQLRDDLPTGEIDNVWARIRDRMAAAQDKMPTNTLPPEFERLELSADALVVGLRWVSPSPPDYGVMRRLLKQLEDELRMVNGTEESKLYGDPDEEILVTLDPERMTGMNLSAVEISNIISASDSKVSAGLLRSQQNNTLLEVDGELDTVSRIGAIPIQRSESGSFVSLEDVGHIEKTIRQPVDTTVLIKSQPAVALGVLIRPGCRIDQWAANVEPIMKRFKASLPESVEFEKVFEQSPYVESRMQSLAINLLISSFAVAAVIFLMMGLRSAILVGAALPLVSMSVLAAMHWLGIPMHQMSITGLIIALGLMIDNAIVVVDEIGQKLREGHTPVDAVKETTSFLALPLFGSTITTTLSFSPIILMGGPAGEFVGSIAIVAVLAVISSFVLAMAITAPLAGLGLRSTGSTGKAPTELSRKYERFIQYLMKNPLKGVGLGLALPTLGMLSALMLPEQFFPPAERNQFQIEMELVASGSLDETSRLATQVREELLKDARVTEVAWFLGESCPVFYYNLIPVRDNAAQYGQAIVTCKPGVDTRELLLEKQPELEAKFPGASVVLRQLEQGPAFNAPVELRLAGPDLNRLRDLGEEIRLVMTQTPAIHHTRANLSEMLPKISFVVDEQKARLANLNHQAIALKLNTTLEGITGGSILEGNEELPVRVRVSGEHRSDLNKIASIELLGGGSAGMPASPGASELYRGVPISAISRMKLDAEFSSITRLNGRRLNEVQAFIDAGVLPSTVLDDVQTRLAESGFELPEGYSMTLGGAAARRDDAVDALMGKVFIISTLMVSALVMSLGSFRFAGVLFLVAGLSVGLGLGSLWLVGLPWGFMSIVAIMGMIGVSVNDSIVVLSSLMALTPEEADDPDQISRCVVANTRHILATTLTTILGFTPLLINGGDFWRPVAVAMSGGVGGATLIALTLVPCLFILIRRRNTEGSVLPIEQLPESNVAALIPARPR